MSRFNCNKIYPMNETEYGHNMNFIAIDIFFVLSPLSCCLRSANKVSNYIFLHPKINLIICQHVRTAVALIPQK